MKIAMVSGHASPLAVLGGVDAGGQNVHVAELSAAMARVETPNGYTVVHVPAGPPERLPEDELLDHMGTFAGFLAEQWEHDRPDVAHGHFWMSGIATQLAARHHHVPTVQTFHGLGGVRRPHQKPADTSPGVRLKLERLVARHATWVAATCSDEVFELVRLGRPRNRIAVVPCGVDLDNFSTEGPVASRGPMHRIISVGRMDPHRGFDTVIEALPAIPDTEFVVVGGPDAARLEDDPEVRRLRALADQLGVGGRVTFTGSVARHDMPSLLRSADLVACTPWYEPFGIVPLEAMACGVPVVATAVGGMLDSVVHDVTGRLIAPKRPRECVHAVTSILRDSFLRRSLGLAGRDRACARYSWDRAAVDTVRVYERLIATDSECLSALDELSLATVGSG
jgi:glycosyltransferase involved in cell wall biosynthesis